MIKIVSDSTCDLSQELTKKYEISIIPLCITLGEDTYLDGIDITPEEIYKWFKIKDGKFNVASLTGRSSAKPVTITIETASDESFALRTCDLMLTMNGKTEVVAKYSLKPLGRVVETYAVKLTEEGGFDSADGKYLFNDV